jgi:chorismate mutase
MNDEMAALRQQIDDCDSALMALLVKRLKISQTIGNYKQANNLSVLQPERFEQMLTQRLAEAQSMGLREQFVRAIFEIFHEEAVQIQLPITQNPIK